MPIQSGPKFQRADDARKEVLPIITDAVENGFASATHDGWTCSYTGRHYYSVTMHFIDLQWHLVNRLLYTAQFSLDNSTAPNVLDELVAQYAALGLSADLVKKIHFVADGGMNIVSALREFSRSYSADHLINIIL